MEPEPARLAAQRLSTPTLCNPFLSGGHAGVTARRPHPVPHDDPRGRQRQRGGHLLAGDEGAEPRIEAELEDETHEKGAEHLACRGEELQCGHPEGGDRDAGLSGERVECREDGRDADAQEDGGSVERPLRRTEVEQAAQHAQGVVEQQGGQGGRDQTGAKSPRQPASRHATPIMGCKQSHALLLHPALAHSIRRQPRRRRMLAPI
mmetsp:Transcript_33702/g.107452  ORF Transcript_33702/g.107452 Transcript_33702/m.107452 type:complete len:206 (-) Transcript_33702:1125-1742(-)